MRNMVALGLVLLFPSCQSVMVETNERGVNFKRFEGGIDTSKVFMPGKYIIAYYDRIIIYNIEPQSADEDFIALSKDEVNIELSVSYTFRPKPEKIALLHYYIGANYPESIVKPAIRYAVEKLIKDHLANEIPLVGKEELESQLLNAANKMSEKKYIEMRSIQIRDIVIP